MTPLELDLGPLLPHHISELVMGVLLMIVIYLVLRAKVVPAFEKMYEQRHAEIEGGIERANRAQAEADAAKAHYQAQLNDARAEAAKIREDAKNQGAQIIAEMRDQAQAESSRILAGGRAQLEAERGQVMAQLRGELGGLATTLAGRIVGESLDDDARAQRTVDRFLADLEAHQQQADQPVGAVTGSSPYAADGGDRV